MKKGMLITLSSLPARDTEIHHHTMIKGPSSPTLPPGCSTYCFVGRPPFLWTVEKLHPKAGGLFNRLSVGNHYRSNLFFDYRCEIREKNYESFAVNSTKMARSFKT